MNFSKIFFEVNICLGCVLVSNNSQIILEEDDEIKQIIEECVKSKNFLKKNVPLVLRLLESKYKNLSIDEINSIVNQLNINFKEEQINSKDYLDKSGCIDDFNIYIIIKLNDKLERFGKLIIRKVKNNNQVEFDCSRCSSFQSTKCIFEFFDSLNKNQKDIKLSNGESLLENYMDFLSMKIFLDKTICHYNRCLITLISELKKLMFNFNVYSSKDEISPSEFDEIFSPKIKEILYQNFFNDFSRDATKIMNIEEKEKIEKFLKEFSKYIVKMIILIEKYNFFYNSLTHFTLDSYVFKYIDNNDDDLRKEIKQLNTKLSNLLFIESKIYETRLNFYIRMFHYYALKDYIPFSYLSNNDSVLGNYEDIINDRDTTEDDVMLISSDILSEYQNISIILVNPSLTRYLLNEFLF
ncbi:hypothetical protein A0H76_1951 [Hepatospora eriocheir]|uniref:Uncharacterized protein n=1 Tax=Hepatospora eriocheir TaxID=1081669 RepID=A0A1X0QKJ0_9MICR|nr:hypothetical protein A0H76_1951 [Hepatospora eriocheir]